MCSCGRMIKLAMFVVCCCRWFALCFALAMFDVLFGVVLFAFCFVCYVVGLGCVVLPLMLGCGLACVFACVCLFVWCSFCVLGLLSMV